MTEPVRDPGYPYGQFDAMKWVEEFDRLHPGKVDRDLMLGWFANAIMTGYDTAHWRMKPSYATRFKRWFRARFNEFVLFVSA